MHCHKHQPRPDLFKAEGKFELWYLMNQVSDLLIMPTPEADVTLQVPTASGVGAGQSFSKRESTAKVHTLQLIIISLVMTFWMTQANKDLDSQ